MLNLAESITRILANLSFAVTMLAALRAILGLSLGLETQTRLASLESNLEELERRQTMEEEYLTESNRQQQQAASLADVLPMSSDHSGNGQVEFASF